MMVEQNDKFVSPLQRVLDKIKRNPVVASLLTLATLLAAISSFTGTAKNLVSLIPESRTVINGVWQAQVKYDWNNADYKETFILRDEGDTVIGTATRFGRKLAIFNGKLQGNTLTFVTKSQEAVDGVSKDVTHDYRGRVQDKEINFVMQTDGGYSQHIPIEFNARLIAENEIQNIVPKL